MFRHKRLLRLLALLGFGCLLSACSKGEPDLPDLGKIGSFSLRDQDNHKFSQENLDGKTWISDFIFTRCPTVCPLMTQRMKELQLRAKDQGIDVHFLSFSVDPKHDTVEVLRAYAKKHGVDASNWRFLTGEYEEVKRTAVEGFKLGLEGTADPEASDFGILHSAHLILIDSTRRIRGYYSTREPASLDRLLKDAASLSGSSSSDGS